MKFFSVLILSCGVLSTKATCLPDASACTDDWDIAKIKCSKSGDEACTLECPGDGDTCSEELKSTLLGDEPIKEITSDVCRDKCKMQAKSPGPDDTPCEFYRWQHDHNPTDETHCSLQTKCVPDPACGGSEDCFSGQNGCTDGHDDKDCSLTKADWEHNKFHVICYDKNDYLDINIYEKNYEAVSSGTICQTVSMCAEWNEQDTDNGPFKRVLAVECNGLTGTWQAVTNSGNALKSAAMIVNDKIVEQECCLSDEGIILTEIPGCKCDALESTTDAWGDLICEEPLDDNGNINEPNSCILLCDNHLNKAFSCRLDYDGDKKWLAEKDGAEIGDVKCE